jgi:hypothetical protein
MKRPSLIVKGRKISLGECKFVFERLWHVTVKRNCESHIFEHGKDSHVDHVHTTDSYKIYMIDLFNVLDVAGKLLNK